jgi:hypothetical protein
MNAAASEVRSSPGRGLPVVGGVGGPPPYEPHRGRWNLGGGYQGWPRSVDETYLRGRRALRRLFAGRGGDTLAGSAPASSDDPLG